MFICLLFQSSSLDFLLSQGFDFNKMLGQGVPYLRPVDEAQLREAIQLRHQVSTPAFTTPGNSSDPGATKGPIDVPMEQREFVDNIVLVDFCVQFVQHETEI